MSLVNESNNGIPATMLVGPTSGMPYYAGNNGGNFGGFGDGGWWILLLFILLAGNNGWGNNGNNNAPDVQRGFDQASVMNGLNGIQPALCSGFAGVNATVNSVGSSITQQMYANQIADMQQSFALQSQFAQCCCDNRTQGLQNTQAIIDSQTRGTQAIIDKLCQLELDNVKQDNANLRTQLNMANLAASQVAQTAELRQSQANTANQLISELRSCPIPAQPVYGSQPIFTCPGNNSGCGCNNNF